MSIELTKLEKFKHGGEISSEQLNLLVETINTIIESYSDISTIKTKSKETLVTVSELANKVNRDLSSVPEVKNLLVDLLLYRDTVNWVDMSEESKSPVEGTIELLENIDSKTPSAERLTIIRGTTQEINLTKPELKDKQILIAFDPVSTEGTTGSPLAILYFDTKINNRLVRLPVTASGPVSLQSAGITARFVPVGDQIKLQINDIERGTQIDLSDNLKGPQGPQGVKGDTGKTGEQGPAGETPFIGDNGNWYVGSIDTKIPASGPTGAPGRDMNVSIVFSENMYGLNPSTEYSGQPYMGLKFYEKGSTTEEIDAKPTKWIRITGDTFYPHYDKKTGLLSFKVTSNGPFEPVYIKGDQGPQGPKGQAPLLYFLNGNKDPIAPISNMSNLEDGIYYYDSSLFKGDPGSSPNFEVGSVTAIDYGDAPSVTNRSTDPGRIVLDFKLPRGLKGDIPNIGFKAELTDSDNQPTVEPVRNSNSVYDQEFLLRIPRGKDGVNGRDGTYITNAIIDGTTGELNLILSDATILKAGVVKGAKGDTGPAGANGKNGQDGKSFTIKSSVASVSLLPETGMPGDAYFVGSVVSQQEMYYWDSVKGTWANAGKLRGAPGPIRNLIQGTVTELPAGSSPTVDIINDDSNESAIINFGIPKGKDGAAGRSITEVVSTKEGLTTKFEIRYSEGTPTKFEIKDGEKGDTGRGISSLVLINSTGLEDTYRITYTDNQTKDFKVVNGVSHYIKDTSSTIVLSPQEKPYVKMHQTPDQSTGSITHEFEFNLPEASQIINAERDPSNNTSDINTKVGNYWLNTKDGRLFKNKARPGISDLSTCEWDLANPLELKGKDGNSFRYGEIIPNEGEGAAGNLNDLYINTKTGNLYKKTGDSIRSWTSLGLSIVGKDGATPEIGDNNHWIIDGEDTGKTARGTSIQVYETKPIGEALNYFIPGDVIIVNNTLYTYTPSLGSDPWKQSTSIQGRGIKDITKQSSNGLVDTYKITLDDLSHSNFTVTNGKDAITPIFAEPSIEIIKDSNAEARVEFSTNTTANSITYYTKFFIPQGPEGQPGKDFNMSIKKTVTSTEEIPTNNLQQGDSFIVKPNGDVGEQILYVCINPIGDNFNEKFFRAGNIKGAQGNTPSFTEKCIVKSIGYGAQPTASLQKVEGLEPIYTLNLQIPEGKPGRDFRYEDFTQAQLDAITGSTPDLSNVTVSTGAEGSEATFQIKTTQEGSVQNPHVIVSIPRGDRGYHYTPSVDSAGNLTWTNNGNLPEIQARNIMGPAAGFGTPTGSATLLAEGSQPTVSVTTTSASPNSAKVFNFQFGIPKGDTGRSAQWHHGTAITSKSSSISATISGALKGDMYINTEYGYVYKCTATNTWQYLACMKPIKEVTTSNGVVKIVLN